MILRFVLTGFGLLLAGSTHGAPATPLPDSLRGDLGSDSTAYFPRVVPLPEIKVAAPRVARPSSRTSVALNAEALRSFLPRVTGEALASVPGVDLIKTGPWSVRPSIRGLSGDRVLLLVDGIPLNVTRGHGAEPSLVAVDQLTGAEVTPGASGVSSSSSALGGVIRLSTTESLYAPQPGLSLRWTGQGGAPGGSWSQRARAALRSESFGMEAAGGFGGLGSLSTPRGRLVNSGFHDESWSLRGGARLAGWKMDAGGSHDAARDVGLPAFASDAGGRGVYPLKSRDALRFELRPEEDTRRLRPQALVWQQRQRTEFIETSVDSVFIRQRLAATRSNVAQDRVTMTSWGVEPTLRWRSAAEWRLSGQFRHEAAAGPHEARTTIRNASGAETGEESAHGVTVAPATRSSLGIALLHQSPREKSIALDFGARWDQVTSRVDSTGLARPIGESRAVHWTAEGGLVGVRGPLELYGHVASGFRAPNLDERFYNGFIHGWLYLFGNPTLRPERSASYELGVRGRSLWGGRLENLRVSAYRSDVRDMISFRYEGQLYLIPRFQYLNIQSARLSGVEASGEFVLGARRVSLQAGWPSGKDLGTNAPLNSVGPARLTVEFSSPAPHWIPRGQLLLRARWSNARSGETTDLNRPAFWTGSAELRATLKSFETTLAITNLFDTAYQEPLSLIPEAGRTWTVAIRRQFDWPLTRARL